MENLRQVMARLQKAVIKLNGKKCAFFQEKVDYLGHIIVKNGLHKDPRKLEAITKAPRPQNKTQVKAFIGMINYYGKFVPSLANKLSPLYKLLQEGVVFKWSKNCEESFNEIKKELSSETSLVHFNPKLRIKLATDASREGIGGVLKHIFPDKTERPICFVSRTLTKAEKNYATIHLEALAIYWSVKKLHQYLMGNKFELESDHKPLQALFGENKGIPMMAAGRLQRWAMFLSGFNYTFKYVKGTANGGADGLSRLPLKQEKDSKAEVEDYFNFFLEDKMPIDAKQIRQATRVDKVLSKVLLFMNTEWPKSVEEELQPFASRKESLSIDNGLILWGYRIIVPEKFRVDLLEELHSSHVGASKMKMLARQYFWWPKLDSQIENYCKSCDICLKVSDNPNKALLIKFEDAKKPLDRIHIDFLGPFNSKTYLIITDAYSKYIEIFKMTKCDAKSTVNKLRKFCSRFGLPKKVVSDNGAQFTAEEFQNWIKVNGILHVRTAPAHPSTNGAAENAVRSFKNGLKKMILDKKNASSDHDVLVSRYLFNYCSTPYCVTEETPAKRMLGREFRTRFDLLRDSSNNKSYERQVENYSGKREEFFVPEQIVYVKDYRVLNKPVWAKAKIIEVLGPRNYLCEVLKEKLIWKRHLDQIIKVGDFFERQYKFLNKQEEENKLSSFVETKGFKNPEPVNSENNKIEKAVVECNDVLEVNKSARREDGNVEELFDKNGNLNSDKEEDFSEDQSRKITYNFNKEFNTVVNNDRQNKSSIGRKNTSESVKEKNLDLNVNSRPKRVISKPIRFR